MPLPLIGPGATNPKTQNIIPGEFQEPTMAYDATVFETSIGDTMTPVAEPPGTTGIGLTPIVIVGGLLLLLFMMTKGRF